MNAEYLNRLTNVTNRSKGQTLFLLELLGYDVLKLLELEEKLQNNFLNYCPGDLKECEKVLNMDKGTNWFNLRVVSLKDGLFIKQYNF